MKRDIKKVIEDDDKTNLKMNIEMLIRKVEKASGKNGD